MGPIISGKDFEPKIVLADTKSSRCIKFLLYILLFQVHCISVRYAAESLAPTVKPKQPGDDFTKSLEKENNQSPLVTSTEIIWGEFLSSQEIKTSEQDFTDRKLFGQPKSTEFNKSLKQSAVIRKDLNFKLLNESVKENELPGNGSLEYEDHDAVSDRPKIASESFQLSSSIQQNLTVGLTGSMHDQHSTENETSETANHSQFLNFSSSFRNYFTLIPEFSHSDGADRSSGYDKHAEDVTEYDKQTKMPAADTLNYFTSFENARNFTSSSTRANIEEILRNSSAVEQTTVTYSYFNNSHIFGNNENNSKSTRPIHYDNSSKTSADNFNFSTTSSGGNNLSDTMLNQTTDCLESYMFMDYLYKFDNTNESLCLDFLPTTTTTIPFVPVFSQNSALFNTIERIINKMAALNKQGIAIFSILTNGLSMIVFIRLYMKKERILSVFIAMSITDTFALIDMFDGSVSQRFNFSFQHYNQATCKIYWWIWATAKTCSATFTLLYTLERFVSIMWPFQVKQLFSKRRIFLAICLILLFSGILEIHFTITQGFKGELRVCTSLVGLDMRKGLELAMSTILGQFVWYCVVAVLNALIILTLVRQRKQRAKMTGNTQPNAAKKPVMKKSKTAMLVAASTFSIIIMIPKLLLDIIITSHPLGTDAAFLIERFLRLVVAPWNFCGNFIDLLYSGWRQIPSTVSQIDHFRKMWSVTIEKKMSEDNPKASFKQGTDKETFKLRHVKYKEKISGQLPVPGIIELSVIGTGANGTPKSLVVDMSHFKYLFNCGEGTQRIATEHKMKLSRVDHIFITHATWANIGGLMGFCLTAESSGVDCMHMHGPPQCESMVTSARSFAQLHTLRVQKKEVSDLVHTDTAMSVEYAPFYSNESSVAREEEQLAEEMSPCYPSLLEDEDDDEESNGRDLNQPLVKKMRYDDSTVSAAPGDKNMAVAYICTPHVKPRALSLEKCVDQGVPAGPIMRELKDGKTVTLSCGKQVHPDDVLESAEPNYPFIVVECPTESYLPSLLASPQLSLYFSDSPEIKSKEILSPCLIIHLTPPNICNSASYTDWMKRFGDSVRHLVINESCSDLSLLAVYEIQAKLNLIHNDIYPLLPKQRQPAVSSAAEAAVSDSSTNTASELNITHGETNLTYVLRAKTNHVFNREKCLRIDNESSVSEVMNERDFVKALDQLKQDLTTNKPVSDAQKDLYPEIIFLGTGSTMPNKVRNVSAIWINLNSEDSMLLDCGENTYGQLYRFYGDQTADMLSRLRAVYISHLHADHHLGLVGLAEERWREMLRRGSALSPLIILSPGNVKAWYTSLHTDLLPILHMTRVIPLERLYVERRDKNDSLYAQALNALQLSELQVVRALHRQWPHSVAITHRDGWKLSYSGDTMPCAAFVEAGMNSDILIHEATMEDTLEEEAKQRRHSTTSQAISIGRQMKARNVILTHFSQRYAKVPLFNDNFSSNVGIAFDNMRVRPRDLPVLSKFTGVLKAMFVEHYSDMELKTLRKSREKKEKKAKQEKTQQQAQTSS